MKILRKVLSKIALPIAATIAATAAFAPARAADSGAPPINFRIVATTYHAADQVVAGYTDRDWNLDRTGQSDCSGAIQSALTALGAAGGGTLFLESGTYRLDNPVKVPAGVDIRGEIGKTADPYRYQGTTIAAYAGENQPDSAPLITLTTDAGIRDCIIWYPRQNPDSIVAYPPSVDHQSASTSVDNVVFVNSYQAYRSGYNMSGRAYVRDVRGTPLAVGLEIDALADTGRVENVDFSPEYWAHSGLPGAPAAGDNAYRQFMLSQGTGILERRIDWTNTADVSIDGYNKGFATDYSKNTEDLRKNHFTVSPNGENYNYKITNCVYGVCLNCMANAGMIFTRFNIQATDTAFYIGEKCDTIVTVLDSTLSSPAMAINNVGPGRLLMRDCTVESGATETNGLLDCVATAFAAPACKIVAADTLSNASFFGDKFAVAPVVGGANAARAAVHIIDQPQEPRQEIDAPPIDFEAARGATQPNLFIITAQSYGAVGDGKTDCTAAFKSALAAAGNAGGGIVFVPGGAYVVSSPLTVPSGVELRGIFDGPHDAVSAGSCILVSTGQGQADGPAFLTLAPRSTVRGLNFHYPGQEIANIVDFPFLIRGAGEGVTVIDAASANVSRFVDLMTNRCDDAYVDHLEGQPIHLGIQVGHGSRDVSIADCQFNPSNWTFATIFNAPKVEYPNNAQRSPIVNAYTAGLQQHGVVYVLGDCTGLKFYRDFVFAGRYGLRCIAENGRGPSGVCLELGVDGSTTALRIDAVGPKGFPFVNSQLVVTSNLQGERHAVEVGDSFTGTAQIYGLNEWGPHTDSAFQVLGGSLRVDGAHLRDPGNPVCDVRGGALTVSASCIRRDTPILPAPGQTKASVRIVGDILPETSSDITGLGAGSNMVYTDPGSPRILLKQ